MKATTRVIFLSVFLILLFAPGLVNADRGLTVTILPGDAYSLDVKLTSIGKSYVLKGECENPEALQCFVQWMKDESLIRKDVYVPDNGSLYWAVYAPANANIGVVEIRNTAKEKLVIKDFSFSQEVVSASGEIKEVSEIEDICEPLDPKEYWSLFPPLPLPHQGRIIQMHPIFNRFFEFGFINTAEFGMDIARKTDEMMNVPVKNDMLGMPVEKDLPDIIAGDIRYNPYMKGHSTYSTKYYPRRMQDYIESYFLPAYILSEDPKYLARMEELLAFLQYSQWKEDGSNDFVKEVFPEYNALHPEWYGGFDYLFDWEWLDAYRYLWRLHEPDHHVSSIIAGTFITGYELTGKESYFQTAFDFVYNQFPRYGFHKGKYKDHVYYWTEYNPTGLSIGNPVNDATDNINALTAYAAAKIGYHIKDPDLKARFLELARGLLWYLVREYDYDGWFYYDGAENPLNPRKAVSHDTVCIRYAFSAMAYLYKAGADIDELLESFERIDADMSQRTAQLKPMADLRVYKIYEGDLVQGSKVTFTVFVKVNSDYLSEPVFSDSIAPSFKTGNYINVRISKIRIPDQDNPNYTVGEDTVFCMQKKLLNLGVRIPFDVKRGDILRISYDVICKETIKDIKTNAGIPKVEAKTSYPSLIQTVSATTTVRGYVFNMALLENARINSSSFLSLSARMHFPLPDETEIVLEDKPKPRCMEYRERKGGFSINRNLLKPYILKQKDRAM